MRRLMCGGFAGDAQQPVTDIVGRGPDRAAHAAAMDDAVRIAAQRNLEAVRERRRLGQALEPGRDPGAMLLREVARLPQMPRGGMVRTTSREAASMRSV